MSNGPPPPDTPPDASDVTVQEQFPQGDKAQRELRVREQCYLVRNLNRYARSRLLGYEQNLMPDGKSTSMTAAGGSSYTRASGDNATLAQNFKNLILTNAEPGRVVSSLAGTNNAAAFLNVRPNVLSRLVPHIELQKVFYDLEKKGASSANIMSKNGVVVPLPFANNYSQAIAEDILKNRAGQGEGIGLKSVNVKFLGTNPAEVKTMLEVNMKIFARDFVELVKVRNVRTSASGEKHAAAFSDLITRDPRRSYEQDRLYRGEVFRIRALLGWSLPTGRASSILDDIPDADDVKITLKQTKMIITLELAQHTLNFNQDGSLELEVKYIGRLEGEMRNSERTIFNYNKKVNTVMSDKVAQAREALRKAKAADEGWQWSDIADWTNSGPVGLAERDYEQAVRRAKQVKKEELGRAYREFLTGFFESKKHSLFWLRIPPYVYRQSLDPRVPNPEFGGATVAVERLGPDGVGHFDSTEAAYGQNDEVEVFQLHGYLNNGDVYATRAGAAGGVQDGRMKQAIGRAFSLLKDEEGGNYEEAMERLNRDLSDIGDERASASPDGSELLPDSKGDFYNLYFTYLGDLIDYAMNGLKDPNLNNSAENIKLLMGSFSYIDPLSYESIKVNVTDIPVSIPSFLNWMFQRYVRREALEVSGYQFMRDIIQDLGIKYLGSKCFSAGSTIATRTRFGTNMSLTVPRHSNGHSLMLEGQALQNKHLEKLAIIKQDESAVYRNPEDVDHICYVYVTNTLPTDKQGIESEDQKAGIYHFRLGADRGLIKKAKYKRLDTPYLQEARIIENDKIDDSPRDPESRTETATLRLKEVYNCDIEMYGNTLFYPGMVFYIDPSKMGLDASSEDSQALKRMLAESLGVKGYYHVNTVEHIFETGKYETLLEGIFLTDGNSEFYQNRTDKQMGRVNRMLKLLANPGDNAAARKFLERFAVSHGQTDPDSPLPEASLQVSEEVLAETESEFTDSI